MSDTPGYYDDNTHKQTTGGDAISFSPSYLHDKVASLSSDGAKSII